MLGAVLTGHIALYLYGGFAFCGHADFAAFDIAVYDDLALVGSERAYAVRIHIAIDGDF